MKKEEFIAFLEEIKAHYKIPEKNTDRVYIYGAPEDLEDSIFIGKTMKFTPYLRDSPDHCKPCLECKEHEEWQPRTDMHLRAYGG